MSPNFIADQIQEHVWTVASMLNSNYGAFCCTPLACRRRWIAARLNALWKQRRGMGECRATRGEKKVRNRNEKRNEMHIKKRQWRGINKKKKEREGKKRKRGIQMVGKLSNSCKKRQRNRTERGTRELREVIDKKTSIFLHYLTPSPRKHLNLPRLTLLRQPSSATARSDSSQPSGQRQLSLSLSATTYSPCHHTPSSHHPPAPWLPILPKAIILCWQKTTSFPSAVKPWVTPLPSGS